LHRACLRQQLRHACMLHRRDAAGSRQGRLALIPVLLRQRIPCQPHPAAAPACGFLILLLLPKVAVHALEVPGNSSQKSNARRMRLQHRTQGCKTRSTTPPASHAGLGAGLHALRPCGQSLGAGAGTAGGQGTRWRRMRRAPAGSSRGCAGRSCCGAGPARCCCSLLLAVRAAQPAQQQRQSEPCTLRRLVRVLARRIVHAGSG
jgi:hypothetical protein